MGEWIIAGNPKRYDVVGAFHKLKKVDWRQNANIATGDIVYIYVSGDVKALQFKCRANKVDLVKPDIDDLEFDVSGEFDGTAGRYMELEMVEEFSGEAYSREELMKHGFRSPLGPIKLPDEVKKYLNGLKSENFFIKNQHQEILKVKTDIDYVGVLDYLEHNREIPYSDPDTVKDNIKKQKCFEIKRKGQEAVAEINKIAELCKEEYGLDKCLPVAWLDGSKTKTSRYLWAQTKYSNYASDLTSISIFVEYGDNGPYYRVSLEIKNDGVDRHTMDHYHSHLDLPLNRDAGLCYVSGSNKWGRPDILNESQSVIQSKVAGGGYRKVQICKVIESKADETNGYYEREILSGVAALIPYYEHVLGIEPKDEYWPPLSEYDPGITKDMWLTILENYKVTSMETLYMLKWMLELGGETTCANLEALHGNKASYYNRIGTIFAQKIEKAYSIEPYEDNNGNKSFYTIPFLGRNVQEDGNQRYSWKLRDELMEALEEMNLSELEQPGPKHPVKNPVKYDKNMILYGPPGTGKTYNTAIYAVAICQGRTIEDVASEPYSHIMYAYNVLKKENRIAFTTFHQSYGYEEFIEGIKPLVNEEASELGYSIESGVFKKFCENAKTPAGMEVDPNTQIWFVRLDTDSAHANKDQCFMNGEIRFNSNKERETDDDVWFQERFVDAMQIGDYVVSYADKSINIDGIGIIEGEPVYDTSRERYRWTRKVNWLSKGTKINVKEMNGNRYLPNFNIAKMNHMKVSDLLTLVPMNDNIEKKPYIFIIDEINRGNISKIFGELITLIEDTKREGMEEQTSATLPYSGDVFSVPENVYILGTMNTADRSIALMDTALRRRFQFVEMMPSSKVLRDIGADKVEDLDVAAMLDTINERITFLYDREHTIGHAFFTKLAQTPTLECLNSIFEKSVIPLLQEYFYEDYQKIQLVLGDNGKTDPNHKFILDEEIKVKSIFKGNAEDVVDLPEKKYTINAVAFNNIESYKEII